MSLPVLGILTLYLNNAKGLEERTIYEKMTVAGRRIGIFVYIFTPQDVESSHKMISAQIFNSRTGTWIRKFVRFPDVIYDRSRIQKSQRYQQLLAFRKQFKHLAFLNRPLANKWAVHSSLDQVPAFKKYLPKTVPYQSQQNIAYMLNQFPTIYVKPVNGTGGRGILRIDQKKDGSFLFQGRNHAREIIKPRRISAKELGFMLDKWDKNGQRYIIQQGIDTKLSTGKVHDYRMLVQKDGIGRWQVTGCFGRIGARQSITSNLHGGGEAVKMEDLLAQNTNNDKEKKVIYEQAQRFSLATTHYLETVYNQLCELALDLAIDGDGKIWLLEVNPKPSREGFRESHQLDVYHLALERPIEYALWACQQIKDKKRTKSSL